MIRRAVDLVRELAGVRWHSRPQQERRLGILRAFLGAACEFGDDCAWPGLGWRCGHRRQPSRLRNSRTSAFPASSTPTSRTKSRATRSGLV